MELRQQAVERRLDPRNVPSSAQLPGDLRRRRFAVSARGNATAFGGVAVAAQLIDAVGLKQSVEERVKLLRAIVPIGMQPM